MTDKKFDTDYTDDLDSADDGAFYDEYDQDSTSDIEDEWTDSDETDGASSRSSSVSPQKKKSSFSTVIVVVLVILAGLGFLAYKFGNKQSLPGDGVTPPVDAAQQQGMPSDAASPQPEGFPPYPDQSGSLMTAPGQPAPDAAAQPVVPAPVDPAVAAQQQAPAPTPAPTPAPVGDQAAGGAPQNAPGSVVPFEPVSDFPSVDAIKKTDEAVPAAAAQAQALDQEAAVPSMNAAPSDAIDMQPVPAPTEVAPVAVQAPADAAPKPDMAAQKSPEVAAPVQKMAPVAEPAPTPSPDEKDLMAATPDEGQGKISELQDTLDKERAAAKKYKSEISDLKARIAELESVAGTPSKQSDLSSDSVEAPRPVTTSSAKVKTRKAVKAEAPVEKIEWVLKSAQPGRALLARKGQSDYTTATIGAKIPGLGKILTIDQGRDGWVVVGTGGRVTE